MNFKTKCLLTLSCLLLSIPLTASAIKSNDIRQVDCTKGESIMKALKSHAEELIIEISGVCTEDVQVRRSNVTLRGTDPLVDGIQPAPGEPLNQALNLFGVHNVVIEGLKLTGGTIGLAINYSFGVDVRNCLIEDNRYGVISGTGSGSNDMVDTLVTGLGSNEGTGILIKNGSGLRCWNCLVSNFKRGVQLTEGSEFALYDSSVWGFNKAIEASGGSRVYTNYNSTLNTIESPNFAIILTGNASMNLGGASWNDGNTAITGRFDLREKSVLTLQDTVHTLPGQVNRIYGGSSLVARNPTSLTGSFSINEFSTLTLLSGSTVSGNLNCNDGADAFCDSAAVSVGGTSNCGKCP